MQYLNFFLYKCAFSCSLERLPSLRPKRDLTLGGVPKVSEAKFQSLVDNSLKLIHTEAVHLIFYTIVIFIIQYTPENICSHHPNLKENQEGAQWGERQQA